MDSKWIVLIVLFALASCASAWTDYMDTYFCERAVNDAWNPTIYDECIGSMNASYQNAFCSLSGDNQAQCDAIITQVNPAVLPNRIGEGELQETGACPIDRAPESNYLCAKKNDAMEKARYWLSQAYAANDPCLGIYMFCAATNYIAQSYNPFNTILNEETACRDTTYRKIDFAVRGNQTSWGTNELCSFSYNLSVAGGVLPRTFEKNVLVNNRIVEATVTNLTAEARSLRRAQVVKSTSKTTTTTVPGPIVVANASKTSCQADSDCMLTQADCCGCTSGGKNIAIAKAYDATWNGELSANCKNVACVQVISQDPSCTSQAVCDNNNCALKANAPATTTTLNVPTTTLPVTTTQPTKPTLPPTTLPTTTTLPEIKSSGSNTILYIAFILVIVGVVYVVYTLSKNAEAGGGDTRPSRKGLQGYSSKDTRIGAHGPSRLGEADHLPRAGHVPVREHEHKEERKEHTPKPPESEYRPPEKRKVKSILQEQDKSDTSLGRK
jgi:hypothetical protein